MFSYKIYLLKYRKYIFLPVAITATAFNIQAQSLKELSPIEIARIVADRIVDSTTFTFNYVVQPLYPDAEIIDFGNTYGTGKAAVAYGLSTLFSETSQEETIEIGHTDGLKIWINDKVVYEKRGNRNLPIIFEEKTYVLPQKIKVNLSKGANKILIKSECRDKSDNWKVILQSNNMGRYAAKGKKITASLRAYAPNVPLSNWLVVGPFNNTLSSKRRPGLTTIYEPENELQFYKIYKVNGRSITWNIPRINIIAENPGGGKFYDWSYHVGNFVWGLQRLSEATGIEKYATYATNWCGYILETKPLADYQTKRLHAIRSANWSLAGRPMLDYTTAPAMPFIYKLVTQKQFENRELYQEFAKEILNYVSKIQFRLPDGVFARKFTTDPSVWADDMFMGIPFLLYAAQADNITVKQKDALYNDAVNQVIQFHKRLYDIESGSYRQGAYANQAQIKIPFWSRGNGWAIWAVSEVLLTLPKTHPKYKQVEAIYKNHINGIVQHQDEDGYWHNILDDPLTEKESSGTAIFTMTIARGINNGWLERSRYLPIAEKGWQALKTFIDDKGNMSGVKGGTNISADPKDYAKVPMIISDTHGLLPLIFACMEMEKLYASK